MEHFERNQSSNPRKLKDMTEFYEMLRVIKNGRHRFPKGTNAESLSEIWLLRQKSYVTGIPLVSQSSTKPYAFEDVQITLDGHKFLSTQESVEKDLIQSSENKNIEASLLTYVNISRINALRDIESTDYDLARLIRLCEEINIAYENQCYMSVSMLLRAIVDHIPPIFSKPNFTDVMSGYGTKSFKDSMNHLDKGLRKIADSYLHSHIRRRESLPTEQQVHFSPMLDVLLAEVITKLSL
jgi:hypothetical protein